MGKQRCLICMSALPNSQNKQEKDVDTELFTGKGCDFFSLPPRNENTPMKYYHFVGNLIQGISFHRVYGGCLSHVNLPGLCSSLLVSGAESEAFW